MRDDEDEGTRAKGANDVGNVDGKSEWLIIPFLTCFLGFLG